MRSSINKVVERLWDTLSSTEGQTVTVSSKDLRRLLTDRQQIQKALRHAAGLAHPQVEGTRLMPTMQLHNTGDLFVKLNALQRLLKSLGLVHLETISGKLPALFYPGLGSSEFGINVPQPIVYELVRDLALDLHKEITALGVNLPDFAELVERAKDGDYGNYV